MPSVRLVEVDASNWRAIAAVAPRQDQNDFVAPVSYYLCLCSYENDWHPLGIEADGSTVGHVMWAVDDSDGAVWLGGLVIDAAFQGRGIGRAAVTALAERFTIDGRTNLALSYLPGNTRARRLYLDLGFVETGETEGDEIVARLIR